MVKLHFISLGCPKNLVDSEVMLGCLAKDGFAFTDDPSAAEVIVVNTCAFIEDAKKEAIDTVLEMGEHKKAGTCRLLVVAGCLPQRYEKELASLLPEVDIFIGAGEFPRIAKIIEDWRGEQGVHVAQPAYIYDHESPRIHATPSHVAYIKIAEGCFHPCSFCAVPKIRGKFRSRPMKSIIEEARGMIERGVREIDIIAQDTTAYGRDIGEDFVALLEHLAMLKGKKWLRLLYAHPHKFPRGIIDAMREYADICRYLDIPIQHIDDRILKHMGREGKGKDIRNLIELARREVPDVSLRTSLIVGFPGETQKEYDELLDFVCETRFDHLGVFVFSPEEGTKAARLKGRIPHDIAEARRHEIMDVQREISLGNNWKHVGRRLRVLVERKIEGRESSFLFQCRHEGQAPDVDGVVYIDEGHADIGEFANVVITDALEYDLVGRVV